MLQGLPLSLADHVFEQKGVQSEGVVPQGPIPFLGFAQRSSEQDALRGFACVERVCCRIISGNYLP